MAVGRRAADAGRLMLDLVTRDPGFVRGGELAEGGVPVFTFHSLEPSSFERKMRYLKDADYTTLSLAAYLDVLFGRREPPPRSVLVTIDDGRATTWTVGYPILKRLGMRATAFLVTSVVHDDDTVSPTIGDVDATKWAPLVFRDESPDRPFVTWGEARAMRDVIDLESHTHLHARVATGPEPSEVMTEAMRSGYGEFDCPFVWRDRDAPPVRGAALPVGTPLPVAAPRLQALPAYRAADERFESASEVQAAIRLDLSESRRLIREKAGVESTALCYPWHVHSDLAKRLAAECGFVAAFAGKASRPPAISRAGGDPFEIARVGEDYVERLPGPGRRSLLSVLNEKLRRRSASNAP